MNTLQHRLRGWLGALYISAHTAVTLFALPAQAAGFENTMAERVRACTACHGEQGKAGPDGYYPRLAGKPADYLYRQLQNFSEGRRHYKPMEGLLSTLDTAYMQEIAAHFAKQSVPYPAAVPGKANAELLERGKTLATQGDAGKGLPACAQCHGKALTGVLPQTPGLLGLPREYISAQLGGWQTGQRHAHAPDCMAQVAKRLSAADANAVSQWLASQQPPNPYVPAHTAPQGPALAPEFACTPVTPTSATAQAAPESALVARGAYLARLGNCALCHTAGGGAPYAGGKALPTPFGDIYTSNLTSDTRYGLGSWSAEDFWRAMHLGQSRDGRLLYPAFPYNHFTRIHREDSDAIYAFLRSVPAVAQATPSHTLRWPYSTQWALRIWQTLFFEPASSNFTATAPAGTTNAVAWKRGEYLVNGLGHCGACHTARNRLGAASAPALGGAKLHGLGAFAPSLLNPAQGGVQQWKEEDIASLLLKGHAPMGHTRGLMSEVVVHSTQYLSATDAKAIAVYLKSLPVQVPLVKQVTTPTADRAEVMRQGSQIYEKHCANCHGPQGQGQPGAYPALAGSRFVTASHTLNLVQSVRQGGFAPATAATPRPFGMPPFMLTLNDRELASVLTYIRNSWGNQAEPVSEFDAGRTR